MTTSDKIGQSNNLHRYIQWLLDNSTAILAIVTFIGSALLALAASILNLTELNILQAVVVLLTLIGATLLADKLLEGRALRKCLNDISSQLTTALDYTHQIETCSLDDLITDIHDLPHLEERLEGARRVSVSGGSLNRLNEYQSLFEQLAKKGCTLRFLLTDPDGTSVESLNSGVVYESIGVDGYRTQVRSSVVTFSRLASRFPTLCEVRLYTLPPPYGLMIVEKENNTSTILVEIYPFKLPTRDRPMLFLDKQKDPRLHNLFSSQYQAMWDSGFSKPIQIGKEFKSSD
jgi:hypothetical protein